MKKLNNRTVVHWAVKMDLLADGEESLKDVDAAADQVPPPFIKSLEELVAEDTYLRFGDFAVRYYTKHSDRLEKLNRSLDDIKKGFDRIASLQKSGDRSIGELAADEGIIFREDISAIEDSRYDYYRRQKPLKLIIKERYDSIMHRDLSLKIKVVAVIGVAGALVAYMYVRMYL